MRAGERSSEIATTSPGNRERLNVNFRSCRERVEQSGQELANPSTRACERRDVDRDAHRRLADCGHWCMLGGVSEHLRLCPVPREPQQTVAAAIVVVYGAPATRLAACVDALLSTPRSVLSEIVLVDNGAPDNPGAAADIARRSDRVRVLSMTTNVGFAAAVNRGVEMLGPEITAVALINDDATVTPGSIEALVAALDRADESVVGIAPKMLLAHHRHTVDAVGIYVNARAEGANVGIGQPDIGQFDVPVDVFGVCFGAALLRRSAFDRRVVGPLWERAFLYYEDVEWCWRAQLLGYSFRTEPAAVVHHQMSASSRADGYDFKHRFIERNLLLCVLRCGSARTVWSVWLWRSPRLAMRVLRGDRARSSGRALVGAMLGVPRELGARWRMQTRRRRPESEILAYADGQRSFFDPVRYEPTDREAARAAAEAQRSLVQSRP
jgi:GT2 family glycosyltransferase